MRSEIGIWLNQAKEDFSTAEITLREKKYYAAVFFCQQTIEKALKALIIYKRKKPEPIHSLTRLARDADIPEKFFGFLRRLTPEYYLSRYPDATEDSPFLNYNEDETNDFITKTGEVLKWITDQIEKS